MVAGTSSKGPRFPARRPPPVLFPPAPLPKGYRPPPYQPLLSRFRPVGGAWAEGQVERYLVLLESLLPDPQAALDRLLDQQNAEVGAVAPLWKLEARTLGGGSVEFAFTPAGSGAPLAGLLAAGAFGKARVEIELGLARGSPQEETSLRARLGEGRPFTFVVEGRKGGSRGRKPR